MTGHRRSYVGRAGGDCLCGLPALPMTLSSSVRSFHLAVQTGEE